METRDALIRDREIFLMFSYLVSLHNARGPLMCRHLQFCFYKVSRQHKKVTHSGLDHLFITLSHAIEQKIEIL